MKTTELMIGDLVTFKDCQNDVSHTIVKICQIDVCENALVSINGSKVLDEIAVDDGVVGIPLTDEILEKNGFIKRYDYQWEYRDNSCAIVVNIAPQIEIDGEALGTPTINVNLEGALFDINITSDMCVHELQHALRLCKINKQIEL